MLEEFRKLVFDLLESYKKTNKINIPIKNMVNFLYENNLVKDDFLKNKNEIDNKDFFSLFSINFKNILKKISHSTSTLKIEFISGAGGKDSIDLLEKIQNTFKKDIEKLFQKYHFSCNLITINSLNKREENLLNYFHFFNLNMVKIIRLSPFNASNKRQTSFILIKTYFEKEKKQTQILQSDLHFDFYRASGKGGQHVNKTSSAVRVTHIPTKLVASVQDERSQNLNLKKALVVLKNKIKQSENLQNLNNKKKELLSQDKINFGTNINTVICLHPEKWIKHYNFKHYNVNNIENFSIYKIIQKYNSILNLNE